MHKDLQLWDITSRWEGEKKTKKVIMVGSKLKEETHLQKN